MAHHAAAMDRSPFGDIMRSLEREFARLQISNEKLLIENAALRAENNGLKECPTDLCRPIDHDHTPIAPDAPLKSIELRTLGGSREPLPLLTVERRQLQSQDRTNGGAVVQAPAEVPGAILDMDQSSVIESVLQPPTVVSTPSPRRHQRESSRESNAWDSGRDYRDDISRDSSRQGQLQKMVSRLNAGAIGQRPSQAASDIEVSLPPPPDTTLKSMVMSPRFDLASGCLIFSSTLVMAAQRQYEGMNFGFAVGHVQSLKPAHQIWPGGQSFFDAMDIFFGVLFSIELLIKLVALQTDFPKSWWNWLDAFVVVFWCVEKGVKASLMLNPMILRLIRILRLSRLARMVKTIQAFDSLNVLIGSVQASVSVLFWSSCLLFLVQMMAALFMNSMLADFFVDVNIERETRLKGYMYFGTFARAMISMFELALANWSPICRFLIDNVDPWWGVAVLSYKLAVGFAVVNVISGVFLHETFKIAQSDDELMMVQKRRQIEKHVAKMTRLLKAADKSEDGLIQRQEFATVLADSNMRTWLSAMDMEVGDADLLFDFLDDGDGAITIDELINGVARLKGGARSIDLVGLTHKTTYLESVLEEMKGMLTDIGNR